MTLLSSGMMLAIQKVRHRAVDAPASGGGGRPFFVSNVPGGEPPPADYYDVPDEAEPVLLKLWGDISWRDRFKWMKTEGGKADSGTVFIATNIANEATIASGSHVVVEGAYCEIQELNRYPETGDLVVRARKVYPG
jgi:hypothetical protein